jgi:hypothetical protein
MTWEDFNFFLKSPDAFAELYTNKERLKISPEQMSMGLDDLTSNDSDDLANN